MRYTKITIKLLILSLFLGATSLDAFGFLGLGGTSWQEEVLLHDGGKIIVERWVDRGGRHEIGQKPPIKEQHLLFTLPSSKQKITWKVEYCKEVGYADLSPILLDIIDKTPYLVTHPVACLAYNKWKRPNPPYIVFRYTNNEWQQIELQDLPLELKIPNLIISSPDTEAQRNGMKLVSEEKLRKLNNTLRQPEYKTILRDPLPLEQIGMCVEKFRTKDGWTSIYIFRSQPTYERCIDACKLKEVLPGHCPCDKLFNKQK